MIRTEDGLCGTRQGKTEQHTDRSTERKGGSRSVSSEIERERVCVCVREELRHHETNQLVSTGEGIGQEKMQYGYG